MKWLKLLVRCKCKHMNITKLVATMEDGSEVVVFPVAAVTPEFPKVVVPLNTPVELVTA